MVSTISASARIGARGSRLSLWQTNHVIDLLKSAWPELVTEIEVISTTGDRQLDTPLPLLGGKGAFTEELDKALLHRTIDFAVHSLKDLPVDFQSELMIGAIPTRASVADVMISRSGKNLRELPTGAVIGTSSPRRSAQLLLARPDLKTISIRGNIDTRVRKALDPDGPYDAIVLARAGLERLGQLDTITEELRLEVMLPAPGQGALAVECRSNDREISQLLDPIDHAWTHFATTAERAFLKGLGGGCSSPVAAYGWFEADELHLQGRVIATDGSAQVEVHGDAICASAGDARQLGQSLAEEALSRGAGKLIGAQA
jgi:hydroxymethylbilane synthase